MEQVPGAVKTSGSIHQILRPQCLEPLNLTLPTRNDAGAADTAFQQAVQPRGPGDGVEHAKFFEQRRATGFCGTLQMRDGVHANLKRARAHD